MCRLRHIYIRERTSRMLLMQTSIHGAAPSWDGIMVVVLDVAYHELAYQQGACSLPCPARYPAHEGDVMQPHIQGIARQDDNPKP